MLSLERPGRHLDLTAPLKMSNWGILFNFAQIQKHSSQKQSKPVSAGLYQRRLSAEVLLVIAPGAGEYRGSVKSYSETVTDSESGSELLSHGGNSQHRDRTIVPFSPS